MPKVYDKDGRELKVGARAKVLNYTGQVGEVHRHPLGNELLVRFRPEKGIPFNCWVNPNTHRCPDLQLIDQPNPQTKEAASAAPEGAEE